MALTVLTHGQTCHGRACPGHPRFLNSWMPGTRPGMTIQANLRGSWRGFVRIDEVAPVAFLDLPFDVPDDPHLVRLAHDAAKHDLGGRLRPARIGEEHALLDRGLRRVRADPPRLAVAQRQNDALSVGGELGTHARMQ